MYRPSRLQEKTPLTTPDAAGQQPVSEELICALRLSMTLGVGPRIRQVLLERFGSAQAVFAAAPSELRSTPGVGPKLTRQISLAENELDVDAEMAFCREQGIAILAQGDQAYPRLLREIHDPPGLLFVRGAIEPVDALAVAIVGTRHGSHYGLRQARRLGGALARAGFTVVSGLARGIDSAAHRGALEAGGRTLAVLGSGVANIYPAEHAGLAEEVVRAGALISETPPRCPPLPGCFPQRNRIISGLTLGTIIVEAGDRSGALITARLAMEQGREVFAVPGQVDNRASRGCHRLLRDGATLVESVDDVLEQFGPLVEAIPRQQGPALRHPAELSLNDVERSVLDAIGADPTSIDHVVNASGLSVPQVLSTLSVLEMRRLVRRVSGNSVARM